MQVVSAAPEHLKCMGIAFRGYLCTASPDASMLAKRLAALLSQTHRMFVDPASMPRGTAGTGPAARAGDLPRAPLVGLSPVLVLVAAQSVLSHPLALAEVSEACARGCQLALVVHQALTVEALLQDTHLDPQVFRDVDKGSGLVPR